MKHTAKNKSFEIDSLDRNKLAWQPPKLQKINADETKGKAHTAAMEHTVAAPS